MAEGRGRVAGPASRVPFASPCALPFSVPFGLPFSLPLSLPCSLPFSLSHYGHGKNGAWVRKMQEMTVQKAAIEYSPKISPRNTGLALR